MRNGLIGFLAVLLFGNYAAAAAPTEIRVESGVVSGEAENGILSFKGTPYAAPPVGKLRWMPPAAALAWQGVREAKTFSASCMQPVMKGMPPEADFSAGGNVSEDCLTLNIWTPHKRGAEPLPVMVFIHGGAHVIGSSAQPVYDGANFARAGVVLVTINFRLGTFGYFAHPALTKEAAPGAALGNYSFMDQIAALKWVKRNIAAFGGDPNNVTTFGESAGATDQLFLLSIPAARGAFDKAIIQSSSHWQKLPTLADMEKKGAALAAEWGLPGATATAEQLRALPADMVSVKLTGPNLSGLVGPFVDGRLLAETPLQSLSAGRFTDVPVIIGFNSDEGAMVDIFDQPLASFFGAYTPEKLAEVRKLYADEATEDRPLARKIFTDAISAAPSRLMARYSAGGQPTFLYLFSYVPENTRAKWTGAPHGGELVYVFDNLGTLPETLQGLGEFTEQDRHMARIVQSCWVSFAKTGVPHCSDAPAWPAYSAEDNELLEFGTEIVVRKGFRKAKLDFQEQNFGRGFAAQE